MRADSVPVDGAGISADDVAAGAQRERIWRGAELLTDLVVQLVLGQPEGERGGVAGVFVYFYAVELREGDVAEREHRGSEFNEALPDLDFQLTEALVGDDEEVAGAAGRVEELNFTHPDQQGVEGFGIVAGTQEFGGEVVQEEGLDDLLNVGYGGIVDAEFGTVFRGDDGLGHRAEDVGVDFAPLVFPALDHQEPGTSAEDRDGIALEEEATVDVGEIGNDFVGLLLSEGLVVRGHYDKEAVDEIGQVGAVDGCVVLNGFCELVVLEEAGVFGKEAEKEPGHKDVDAVGDFRVTEIVVSADVVVYLGHQFGGLDVGLGFFVVAELLDTGERLEKLKVTPEGFQGTIVEIIVLGVVGHEGRAVAGDVETGVVTGDGGIVPKGDDDIHRFGASAERTVHDFVFYENGVRVAGLVVATLTDALEGGVPVSAKDG